MAEGALGAVKAGRKAGPYGGPVGWIFVIIPTRLTPVAGDGAGEQDEYELPGSQVLAGKVIGMAVPPLMYQRIVEQFRFLEG